MKPVHWIFLALAVSPLPRLAAGADGNPPDWPGFRGPNRDGISSETGLLTRWPDGGPERLWTVPIGSGYSALAAVAGRLYTLHGRDGEEQVVSFDAGTGQELWSVKLDRERRDRFGKGPRSTPLVAEGVVYAAGARGRLAALRAADGTVLWQRSLAELEARVPNWGVAASPILEGDHLIFNVGGDGQAVVAFDKRSGEVVWQSGSDMAGYSAPIAITVEGIRQAVVFSGSQLLGLAPATGEILWDVPWQTAYDINAATPIFIAPDKLFISSGQDKGAALLKLDFVEGHFTPRALWKTGSMQNQFSSSVHVGGSIYGFDDKDLKCLDARSGRDRWRKGGLGHGSLIYADGHLIILGAEGQLVLAQADPRAYREVAHVQLERRKYWTVPLLYGGRLYIRNEKELSCFSVRETGSATEDF